jgi:hypothetical protein
MYTCNDSDNVIGNLICDVIFFRKHNYAQKLEQLDINGSITNTTEL